MRSWETSGRVKIERAKENIIEFAADADAFFALEPYKIVPDYDPVRDRYVLNWHATEQLPLRLSAIAADAIHNLRSALDILWVRVMHPNKTKPPRKQYFPIFDTADELEARTRREIKGFRKDAMDLLKEFKPYKGGNDDVWYLDALDSKNKHEILVLGAVALKDIGLRFATEPAELETQETRLFVPEGPIYTMKHGAEFMTIESDSPKMAMQYQLTQDVAFGEGEILEGYSVLETLQYMTSMVDGIAEAYRISGLLR